MVMESVMAGSKIQKGIVLLEIDATLKMLISSLYVQFLLRGENGDFEWDNDDDANDDDDDNDEDDNDDDDDDDEMFDDAREVTLAGEVCERQAS